MYKLKTLNQFIKESISKKRDKPQALLNEGGAFGHMSHPFDDITLTFRQISDITVIALSGELSKEEIATEKLDGQALAISWKEGRLIAARNKGDRKNYGENAPDVQGVTDKFSGRGGLSDAFGYAASDLENALSKLNDSVLQEIFAEGKKFMHLEIVYPESANVINYDGAYIVFHSVTEYDITGEPIAEDKSAAKKLQNLIKSVNASIQNHYSIIEPVALQLPKHIEFDNKLGYFNNKLSKIQKQFGITSDDATIEDFLRIQFMQEIDDNDTDQILTSTEVDGLLRRWVNGDKSFTLRALSGKVRESSLGKWLDKFDKGDSMSSYKKYIEPLEFYFLDLGATILINMSGFLAANPDKVVQSIRAEVNHAIKELRNSKDITKINKINDLVRRIEAIGGMDSIVPTEGIVFIYNGKTYKFTGTFANVNKILGILKFGD